MWCVGILAYEISTGRTPFGIYEQTHIQSCILHKEIKYPEGMSLDLREFIECLTRKIPRQRPTVS